MAIVAYGGIYLKYPIFVPQKISISFKHIWSKPNPHAHYHKISIKPLQYPPTLTFSNIKWQNTSCADIEPTFPVIQPPPLFFEAKFSLYCALSITSCLSTPLISTPVEMKPSREFPGAKICQWGNFLSIPGHFWTSSIIVSILLPGEK